MIYVETEELKWIQEATLQSASMKNWEWQREFLMYNVSNGNITYHLTITGCWYKKNPVLIFEPVVIIHNPDIWFYPYFSFPTKVTLPLITPIF